MENTIQRYAEGGPVWEELPIAGARLEKARGQISAWGAVCLLAIPTLVITGLILSRIRDRLWILFSLSAGIPVCAFARLMDWDNELKSDVRTAEQSEYQLYQAIESYLLRLRQDIAEKAAEHFAEVCSSVSSRENPELKSYAEGNLDISELQRRLRLFQGNACESRLLTPAQGSHLIEAWTRAKTESERLCAIQKSLTTIASKPVAALSGVESRIGSLGRCLTEEMCLFDSSSLERYGLELAWVLDDASDSAVENLILREKSEGPPLVPTVLETGFGEIVIVYRPS